jgi:hypothetical protein
MVLPVTPDRFVRFPQASMPEVVVLEAAMTGQMGTDTEMLNFRSSKESADEKSTTTSQDITCGLESIG